MNFDSPYNPKETEDRIYKLWEKSGFFNPDKLPKRFKPRLRQGFGGQVKTKSYSVMMAPPNITGSLHMGHVLENTEVDILVRMKRMKGFKTLWLPGIDHAGIATQNAVEKDLRKQEISRHDLGREKFVEKVKEWKEKHGTIILDQLKTLGISADWSRTRYTLDSDYTKAVLKAFKHYYKKGWIYRGKRVINWCVRCATSISDLEVGYAPESAKLYFIKYGPFTLATTRPETKLGDTALAVHPSDLRYKKYVGKNLEIDSIDSDFPISKPARAKKIELKIVADRAVDPKFGTGIIKVTPAHDITDFEISKRHNLNSITIIDKHGRMNENAGARYQGMKTAQAREQIVKDLTVIGLIEKIEDYGHNIARCGRCNSIIEPLPSKQWFLKMKELAKLAIKAIKNKETIITPKKWEKGLLDRLKNERDWNISRQLWWGHQLPVYFCQNKQEKFKIKNSKFKINKENFIVSNTKPKKCPFCKDCAMEQSADVLDTWFSSALWPFATLGWPIACAQNKNSKLKIKNYCQPLRDSDLEQYYPTDFITSGRDILNIWIAKMVFSGMEFIGKSPFKTARIHANVLNKEGRRMSKSLGTGVDPLELIEKYGADATRFGIIYQNLGNQDIRFSEDPMLTGKKFCNKIWNASRFVLGQIDNFQFPISNFQKNYNFQISKPKLQTEADKKILNELKKTTREVDNLIEKYEFGKALHKLYDFFWHDFCDVYIEKSKTQMQDVKLTKNTQLILSKVLTDSLKPLHPFLPFITEEIWSVFNSKKLLLIEEWPSFQK